MANIATIRTTAAAAIEAATPDLETAITYREAHYHAPLREQEAYYSQSETTRTFHLTALGDPSVAEHHAGGGQAYWVQTLRLEVRYQVPYEDSGYLRLKNLTATDAPIFLEAILGAFTGAGNTVRRVDLPSGGGALEVLNADDSLRMTTTDIKIHYTRAT